MLVKKDGMRPAFVAVEDAVRAFASLRLVGSA